MAISDDEDNLLYIKLYHSSSDESSPNLKVKFSLQQN